MLITDLSLFFCICAGTVAEMSRFHTWRDFHHGAAVRIHFLLHACCARLTSRFPARDTLVDIHHRPRNLRDGRLPDLLLARMVPQEESHRVFQVKCTLLPHFVAPSAHSALFSSLLRVPEPPSLIF